MKKTTPYTQMTAEELQRATRHYDKPFVALRESRPLSTSNRRLLSAAKRGGAKLNQPEMTTEELQEATKRYDKPFGGWDEFKPLTRRDREVHRKAQKAGRPRVGKGSKRVMISVEQGLLKRADAYAKHAGINRSQLISRSLETVLKNAD